MSAFGSFGQQGGSARFFPSMYFAPRTTYSAAALQDDTFAADSASPFGDDDTTAAILKILKQMGIDISGMALKGGDLPELAGADLPTPTIDPLLLPPEAGYGESGAPPTTADVLTPIDTPSSVTPAGTRSTGTPVSSGPLAPATNRSIVPSAPRTPQAPVYKPANYTPSPTASPSSNTPTAPGGGYSFGRGKGKRRPTTRR